MGVALGPPFLAAILNFFRTLLRVAMDQFVTKPDGSKYFYERESMWPGQQVGHSYRTTSNSKSDGQSPSFMQFGLQVKDILTHQKSDFQDSASAHIP